MEELIKALESKGKDSNEFMKKTLDMMIMITRDKTGMLLKKSILISEKDSKIMDKFLHKDFTKKEQELALSFYEQIDKLYEDFVKELNI